MTDVVVVGGGVAGLVAADGPRARPRTDRPPEGDDADRDDHPARSLEAAPPIADDDGGRPALRAVNGGRLRSAESETMSASRRDADRAAAAIAGATPISVTSSSRSRSRKRNRFMESRSRRRSAADRTR